MDADDKVLAVARAARRLRQLERAPYGECRGEDAQVDRSDAVAALDRAIRAAEDSGAL